MSFKLGNFVVNDAGDVTIPGNVDISGSITAASGLGGGSGTRIVTVYNQENLITGIEQDLFTPTVAGNYRVSVFAVPLTGSDPGDASVKISWTDASAGFAQMSSDGQGYNTTIDPSGYFANFTQVLQSVVGQPIHLTVINSVGILYSIYVVVEQLVELGGGSSSEEASITMENQASVPSGSFTLFTPTESGLYSMNMYMVGTVVGGGGSSFQAIQFTWQDSSGTIVAQSGNNINTTGAVLTESTVALANYGYMTTFYAVAGVPVQYSFDNTINGGGTAMTLLGGDTFSLYLKIFKVDTASGGSPAGADGDIQFNQSGAFGANANFHWDNTNHALNITHDTDGIGIALTAPNSTGMEIAFASTDSGDFCSIATGNANPSPDGHATLELRASHDIQLFTDNGNFIWTFDRTGFITCPTNGKLIIPGGGGNVSIPDGVLDVSTIYLQPMGFGMWDTQVNNTIQMEGPGGTQLNVAVQAMTIYEVGFGPHTAPQDSIFEISTTNFGFLPPRMTTTQRNAINSGVFTAGLTIFNTTTTKLEVWDGSTWQQAW